MNIIISQNLKNVLKNEIKNKIFNITKNMADFIVDNLLNNNSYSNTTYFDLISSIESSTREAIKNIIVVTLEEFDNEFKNSKERLKKYVINKSNVNRTLITIVGEISFKRTYYQCKNDSSYFFFIDEALDLPKNDHYDPIVKGIAINEAVNTSQSQASRNISSNIFGIQYYIDSSKINAIPRQSIYNWIKKWNTPDIVPNSVSTPDTLYVMADEKYLGSQNSDKDIMVKCFVAFEGVKDVSKNRRALINRFVFSCYGKGAWDKFMDLVAKKYDFSKIHYINLLGDGGSWIKKGVNELKLEKNNKVKFYLCEFHFKQAINRITTNKEERKQLLKSFKHKSKNEFKNDVYKLIENNKENEEKILKNLNYIMNNYSSIKSMLELNIGSSMESHISHLIANLFASRPKGFSTLRISQYLKINDYKNNNINIFNLYIKSYKNNTIEKIDEENANSFIYNNFNAGNIPILSNGQRNSTYIALNKIAH